jgi:hypothetical protein
MPDNYEDGKPPSEALRKIQCGWLNQGAFSEMAGLSQRHML